MIYFASVQNAHPITFFMQVRLLIIIYLTVNSCYAQEKDSLPQTSQLKLQSPGFTMSNLNEEYDPYFIQLLQIHDKYVPKVITRNILQDRNGDIWLATFEGLIRYSNGIFTNITVEKHLRKFRFFSIFEDSKGILWFGTIGAGVYRFDGRKFDNITSKEELINDRVMSIVEAQNGDLWFGTNEGISRYDGASFVSFTIDDGLSNNSINSMIVDESGKIWVATSDGISVYDGARFNGFYNAQGNSFGNTRCLMLDQNHKMWIGGEQGLSVYDGISLLSGEAIFVGKSWNTSISTKFVGCISKDREGNLWISVGEPHGMTAYKYDGSTLKSFIEKEGRNNYYSKTFSELQNDGSNANQVFSIYEDKNGNIWFGTFAGISRFDGSNFVDFKE
ncbi:MAG: two-component regulator propeller domain-containing protein [Saprospiraceae bacterium]